LQSGQYKVYEGVQRFKYYEDIDVRIDISEKSFQCWRIFPNVPTDEDENKDLIHEFPFNTLSRWRTTGDKLIITFYDWVGDRSIILTTPESQPIVDTINQILSKITSV